MAISTKGLGDDHGLQGPHPLPLHDPRSLQRHDLQGTSHQGGLHPYSVHDPDVRSTPIRGHSSCCIGAGVHGWSSLAPLTPLLPSLLSLVEADVAPLVGPPLVAPDRAGPLSPPFVVPLLRLNVEAALGLCVLTLRPFIAQPQLAQSPFLKLKQPSGGLPNKPTVLVVVVKTMQLKSMCALY